MTNDPVRPHHLSPDLQTIPAASSSPLDVLSVAAEADQQSQGMLAFLEEENVPPSCDISREESRDFSREISHDEGAFSSSIPTLTANQKLAVRTAADWRKLVSTLLNATYSRQQMARMTATRRSSGLETVMSAEVREWILSKSTIHTFAPY